GEKCRTTRGAALLAVIVKETKSLVRDAIDVWCGKAHHAVAVATEIGDADVVTKDDEDVGFLGLRLRVGGGGQETRRCQRGDSDAPRPAICWFWFHNITLGCLPRMSSLVARTGRDGIDAAARLGAHSGAGLTPQATPCLANHASIRFHPSSASAFR